MRASVTPSLPIHLQIKRDIEARIMSGEWRPGGRIPYEHELMEVYGCSRMTVNKALRSLIDAGMLESRRRAGTYVTIPNFSRAALRIPDIRDDVNRSGNRYEYRLLSKANRSATERDRQMLRIEGGEVVSLECLHVSGNLPHALETRLINLEAVPDAATVDFSIEPPGSWLLAHVPWTEAEHRIAAVAATADEAELLEIAPGDACLALERWTWRKEERITYVRQVFPGDRYSLTARFSP